jgi:hypothetical protein
MTKKQLLSSARNHAIPDPKFTTKDGWMNAYALSCGYVQKLEYVGHIAGYVEFFVSLEGYCNGYYLVCHCLDGVWHRDGYDSLLEARKLFLSLARKYYDIPDNS